MARRVIADYVEVLQTDGGSARVTQTSAETLTGGNPSAQARATQLSAEALLTNNTAVKARATQLSAEVLQTVGTNPAIARVTMVSAEVLLLATPATTQRHRVVWVL